MTRIAFCADVHLGNHRKHGGPLVSGLNKRARDSFPVLKAAVDLALEQGAAALVVLGDLFDVHRPEPQIIAATQEVFGYAKERGLHVVTMLGNHEQQSVAEGDHALGPLAPVATVVEQPRLLDIDGVTLALVPFRPGQASVWLKGVVDALFKDHVPFGNKGVLLGIHLGIADDDTPAFLRSAHDAIHVAKLMDVAREHGVTNVFAGNWHNRARWMAEAPEDPNAYQLGALVPTGWDNEGHRYGGVAVWDSDDEKVSITALPGPRFLSVDSLSGLQAVAAQPVSLTKLYVQAKLPREDIAEGLALLDAMKTDGRAVAVEALAVNAGAKEAAREAAKAASSADNLDDSLAAYIEKMDLETGVGRAEVLRMSKNYLSKGAAK